MFVVVIVLILVLVKLFLGLKMVNRFCFGVIWLKMVVRVVCLFCLVDFF